MGLASTIHDLKTLILSLHPMVVIETTEEERVANLLDLIAEEIELTCFDWTLTRGLMRRVPEGGRITGTKEPSRLMRHLNGLALESIVLLRDFAPLPR